MDAQAYLIRHGWSGPGNPLNPNQRPGPHGGLGLTKPILVARKQNNHGVGKKTTKDPTNQWWLRGFEDALKGIGEEKTSATQNNALTSELYRHFVRGECLAGTIEKKTVVETSAKSKSTSKRKRDSEDKDERRAKKEEKAARKEEKRKRRKLRDEAQNSESADVSSSGSQGRQESKEERRLRKKEKKARKERKAEEKKAKKLKRSASEEDYPTPISIDETADDPMLSAKLDESFGLAKEKKEQKESKKSKSKNKESDAKQNKSDSKKSKKERVEKTKSA